MSRSLKVWLVEYAGALSTNGANEGERVRNGIRERLASWFHRVVNHARARANMPTGFTRSAQVVWSGRLAPQNVDPHDLVLHFDLSSVMGRPNAASPLLDSYNAATGRQSSLSSVAALKRAPSGGETRLITHNGQIVPILSVIYVLYDAQLSNPRLRVGGNVETLSLVAFHEAAHNKDRTDSLHTSGGGGIFADIHTGGPHTTSMPNDANIGFFAERIWNWGPQYVVGASLAPQRALAPAH
jgi:hypothetical protein